MAKEEDWTAAIQALSLFTGAAVDIHRSNLAIEEKERDRDYAERQSDLAREHEFAKMDVAHQNAIEQDRINYEQRINEKWSGVEWINGQPQLHTYDISKSMAMREQDFTLTTTALIDAGISFDSGESGSSRAKKLRNYDLGFNYASTVTRGISDDISNLMGGDVSQNLLTGHDVEDAVNFFNNSLIKDTEGKTVLGPIAVQQFQALNLIPSDVDILTDNNGLPYVGHEDTELLQNMLKGLQDGALQNTNIMNNMQYNEYIDNERNKNIVFAGQIAESPGVANASLKLNNIRQSFTASFGFGQTESGVPTIRWNAEPAAYEDVMSRGGVIDDIADKDADFAGKRATNVKMVINNAMTGAGGLDTIVNEIRGMDNVDKESLIKDLLLVEKMSGLSFVKQLKRALELEGAMDNVANETLKYYESPKTIEEVQGVKGKLRSYGIIDDIFTLREMQMQGVPQDDKTLQAVSTNYGVSLEKLAREYKDGIKRAKDAGENSTAESLEREYQQLQDWLDLEASTFDLNYSINFGGN